MSSLRSCSENDEQSEIKPWKTKLYLEPALSNFSMPEPERFRAVALTASREIFGRCNRDIVALHFDKASADLGYRHTGHNL